jgi:hypothetical protein
MKLTKKLFAVLSLMTLLFSSLTSLDAEEYCADNGGCGYTESCRTSSLAPAIALGTIAVAAIVAIAVQNTSGHAHCHSHQ